MANIGCSQCAPFGGAGYRLDRSRDRTHPGGRVVVCDCVVPLCTCGALRPQTPTAGPSYGELPSRSEQAVSERECVCWPVRRRVRHLNRLLAGAGIPDLYRGKLIEDFRWIGPDGRPIPDAENVAATVTYWRSEAAKGKEAKGLYLHGVPGDGKTLLACGLLTELILIAGRPGLFVNLSRGYFQRLRNTFDDDIPGAETTEQVFNRLTRVPYLVLDDLGVERGSTWEVEWLYNLIDTRYQNRAPLIVTGNHSIEDLRELSLGRIASRLSHMCRSVKMPDMDLRTIFEYGA